MVKAIALLLPVLAVAAALLGGAAGGDWLRSAQTAADAAPAAEAGDGSAAEVATDVRPVAVTDTQAASAQASVAEVGQPSGADRKGVDFAYMEFPQQFFVPLVRNGTLRSVMILSISLELPDEIAEAAYRQENRLRDAILRALLIHANSGGFDGNFTADAHVDLLRQTLLQTARTATGLPVSAVMIGDIARQDQ